MLSLDLLYMVDIVLAGVLLLAICVALRATSRSLVALGLFLNVVATSVYFASNPAFEMLALGSGHQAAATAAQRAAFIAAGEAMLAIYRGTAYNVSYVLAGLAGMTVAVAMLRSHVFGRRTAYLGVGTNALALIPPTIGVVGLIASLVFLLPFVVWLTLIARTLLLLARERHAGAAGSVCAP